MVSRFDGGIDGFARDLNAVVQQKVHHFFPAVFCSNGQGVAALLLDICSSVDEPFYDVDVSPLGGASQGVFKVVGSGCSCLEYEVESVDRPIDCC